MKNKYLAYGMLWLSLLLLLPVTASADSRSWQKSSAKSQQVVPPDKSDTFLQTFFNSRTRGILSSHFRLTAPEFPFSYKAPTNDDITIYGSLLLGEYGADATPYGIYSFPASTASPVTAVKLNNLLNANGGGTFANDKYYMVNYFNTGIGGVFAYFYIYDVHSWEKISSNRVQLTSVGTDMTYDPVSKKNIRLLPKLNRWSKLQWLYPWHHEPG